MRAVGPAEGHREGSGGAPAPSFPPSAASASGGRPHPDLVLVGQQGRLSLILPKVPQASEGPSAGSLALPAVPPRSRHPLGERTSCEGWGAPSVPAAGPEAHPGFAVSPGFAGHSEPHKPLTILQVELREHKDPEWPLPGGSTWGLWRGYCPAGPHCPPGPAAPCRPLAF